MKTSPAHSRPFRAPGGATANTTPPPVVFTSGEESVLVTFVQQASVNLSYSRPGSTVVLRAPLPIASLVPPAGRPSVVDRMQMSSAIVAAARAAILGVQRPPDPQGGLFYDAQRKIFVDRLTGDSMDDDDVIILPS